MSPQATPPNRHNPIAIRGRIGYSKKEPSEFSFRRLFFVDRSATVPSGATTRMKNGTPNYRKGVIAVFYNTEGQNRVGVETFQPGQSWNTLATWPMTLNAGDQLGGVALAATQPPSPW